MNVYTRKCDDGTTGLFHGGRVAKDSPRPTAYGDVDELQAFLGLARAAATGELAEILLGLERDLWLVMAELACNPDRLDLLAESGSLPTPEMVVRLEGLIDDVSGRFEPPTEFVVPGEEGVAARLDVARTVVHRLLDGYPAVITERDIRCCHRQQQGNLRETLFVLYDLYGQRRSQESVNPGYSSVSAMTALPRDETDE